MGMILKYVEITVAAKMSVKFRESVREVCSLQTAVCCGVGGRALASHTDVHGCEPQCGGRLSSLTCDNSKEVLICHEKGWWFGVHNNHRSM